ncbi:hypothetical protein ACFXTO_046583 [Malus domestica]
MQKSLHPSPKLIGLTYQHTHPESTSLVLFRFSHCQCMCSCCKLKTPFSFRQDLDTSSSHPVGFPPIYCLQLGNSSMHPFPATTHQARQNSPHFSSFRTISSPVNPIAPPAANPLQHSRLNITKRSVASST